jgi:hypothetical protein
VRRSAAPWFAAAFTLALMGRAFAAGAPQDGWVNGQTARLRVVAKEMPRHDGSYGSAEIRLETLADHRVVSAKTREGTWTVICYVPAARAFVLGGQFEMGAWLPLDVIEYVDEATGALRESRYGGGSWMAFAAVPSPDGRFIAFVAARRNVDPFRLEVLDVARDALFELGPAPRPPPEPSYEPEAGHWGWADPVDGLVDMDPGILTFPDDHTLRATYGADTYRRRAAHRSVRSWDLADVVSKRRPLKPLKDEP